MKMIFRFLCLISITLSCAPARFVEPLNKKELAVGLSFGGPTLNYGVPVPLPLSSLEFGYGIDSNLTCFGGLHTSALLFGNLQFDMGATYKLLNQNKTVPNISISPGFNFISNFDGSTKFWPIFDINAYWNYGSRLNYFYIGFNNYFELSQTMALDQPQAQHWLFSPQIGHVLKSKTNPGQLSVELKFLGPNLDNSYAFIPYYSATGNRGALGIFLGYRWVISKN